MTIIRVIAEKNYLYFNLVQETAIYSPSSTTDKDYPITNNNTGDIIHFFMHCNFVKLLCFYYKIYDLAVEVPSFSSTTDTTIAANNIGDY